MQIILKTFENDFLASVQSISVIDKGKQSSQFSHLPESQNLCELRGSIVLVSPGRESEAGDHNPELLFLRYMSGN